MAFVDPFGAAGSHKNIFVIIGHPDHLMWDHLSDGEDQVMSPLHQQPVDLGRPGIRHPSFRY